MGTQQRELKALQPLTSNPTLASGNPTKGIESRATVVKGDITCIS